MESGKQKKIKVLFIEDLLLVNYVPMVQLIVYKEADSDVIGLGSEHCMHPTGCSVHR